MDVEQLNDVLVERLTKCFMMHLEVLQVKKTFTVGQNEKGTFNDQCDITVNL